MVERRLLHSPRSKWSGGCAQSKCCRSCRGCDELLDREIFYTLKEAKVLIERWRREYNTVRPHSALGGLSSQEFLRAQTTESSTESVEILAL